MIPIPPPGPHLFGPLLAELRSARGWSQQRMAAELCAAAGVPTLTRHEVSRWERQRRLPGDFWLGWLAVVLGAPGELLAEAAARSRRLGAVPAAVDRAGSRARLALLTLAHRWSADPSRVSLGGPLAGPALTEPSGGAAGPGRETGPVPVPAGPADPVTGGPADPMSGGPVAAGGGDLAELRRWDDLLGGADLTGHGAHRLRRAARALTVAGPAGRRRLLPVLAESAQLAGWLAADAGDLTGGLDAYRLALAAGDPALAGHVLGSASHLLAGAGDPVGALTLARIGYSGARDAASPGLRALLLHRVAFAAALAGRSRAARPALDAAERTGGPEPGREPPWLYWLDEAELAALTGRTLVALGRPGPAVPLLGPVARGRDRPRRAAVYGGWLARGYLQLGEVAGACAVAGEALLDAVRSGSPRAVGQLTEVRRRLAVHRDEPAAGRYASLFAAARPYLPVGAAGGPGAAGSRRPPSKPRHGGTTRPPGTG
ncbi:helix-turn-helix domain-containing protein [Micromonospora sp. DR5-3]|uniref:helix-turn-helix domain-containing protein n=1 Tax=unclassified Micromonospora TaxID=2617518 RepID=UPI0011D814FB|nr:MULTISPECIES: helix-turn-helix transcriptional regulator [unclassified Micromonospora]MCW3819010.1 helix-turn-helix domain-containing protein [Micromonospora sp. DR5-3]TYC21024.1 helix-turn-helix domain-containing protein [Micromonospora sp. MP36]